MSTCRAGINRSMERYCQGFPVLSFQKTTNAIHVLPMYTESKTLHEANVYANGIAKDLNKRINLTADIGTVFHAEYNKKAIINGRTIAVASIVAKPSDAQLTILNSAMDIKRNTTQARAEQSSDAERAAVEYTDKYMFDESTLSPVEIKLQKLEIDNSVIDYLYNARLKKDGMTKEEYATIISNFVALQSNSFTNEEILEQLNCI